MARTGRAQVICVPAPIPGRSSDVRSKFAMAATIRVLRDVPGCVRGDHDSTHVQPDDYLAATSELIFLSLAVAWIITWFTNPQVIASNPLKDRIGYNNPRVPRRINRADAHACAGASAGTIRPHYMWPRS